MKIGRLWRHLLHCDGDELGQRTAARGERGLAHLGPAEGDGGVWAVAVAPPLHLGPAAAAETVGSSGTGNSTATGPSGGSRWLRYLDKARQQNGGSGRCGAARGKCGTWRDREGEPPPCSGRSRALGALCSLELADWLQRKGWRFAGRALVVRGALWCGEMARGRHLL